VDVVRAKEGVAEFVEFKPEEVDNIEGEASHNVDVDIDDIGHVEDEVVEAFFSRSSMATR
jgi:hypothetical protein